MKLLIIDRDGVINYDSKLYIKSVEEWIPLPGSIEAIAQLNNAGWTVAIATNQSGIARGYYNIATMNAIHAYLRALVAKLGSEIGLIVYCPHKPNQGCNCRKPKPGMLKTITEYYKLPLAGLWFVGDSLDDLEAAQAVDCQPVLVTTGKGKKTQAKNIPVGTLIFEDLAAVAEQLVNK
ncbi:D-glycero-beta-D-manno-heptose 1,7-bisphosphate 7-phosphatase [Candidatus Pseudomonas adelgestsugas]|uniref:D,D-heptose 1,7-bisphosphate phosphatase n=1 Tax=Candidatus Pseudomonas adelgestsugas TaxID=1302376 RepID=A0ABX5RAD9_9PSED|nr:D-glycero-beta-D-manno-heptose 1,7-bisphosphate 7-phosphatase [Candidatus Pseudomonas adelgestsugas]QAX82312.1 D-glycero-beta-D-manno-heptose-1,7-bisphosphate 7-phosphatase [Candidatus Pseudomonas adelgestsugas]